MSSKIALIAVGLLLVIPALVACGGDDCTRASDHQAECTTTAPGTTGSGMMTMLACSGAYLCQSQCIVQHTCTQINGNDPGYLGCLAGCQGR